MVDATCKIILNEELKAGYYRLVFEKAFDSFQPGQFCMLKVPGLTQTLLRRPFSLCQEEGNQCQIIYKNVGPTTKAMSHLQKGDQINILGPLGKGLDWTGFEQVFAVAGGYGIAPMLGLGTHLKAAGINYQVFYGARSQSDLLLEEDFEAANIPLHISTDDGSKGYQGLVTELLASHLRARQAAPLRILLFSCGPHGLLKASAAFARDKKIDCHVSMEEYMGCGIGVCLGCVVKTDDGTYKRSCVEGPVMDAEIVLW
jgi:dihydroorotate dehydrogenase electron transfer subunit